jgi:hypothetical protein
MTTSSPPPPTPRPPDTIGDLVVLLYEATLERHGDPDIASTITAMTINRMLNDARARIDG